MNEYIVIDIETTGLECCQGDEITEIAACRVIDDDVIETYSSLCKIKGNVSKFIEELTGINDKMLKNASSFDDVFTKFLMFLDIKSETNIVIHNKEFDYNFLMYWIKRYKIPQFDIRNFESANYICSLEMARDLLPNQSHKLEVLKDQFGIKSKSHRALNDVLVTKKIYQELLKIEKGM